RAPRRNRSMSDRFLVHVLFDRHLRQGPAIVALVTADPKFFDPLFLNIGLAALRTDKYALLVMHHAFFFHRISLRKNREDSSTELHRWAVNFKRGPISEKRPSFLVFVSFYGPLFHLLFDQHAPKHLADQRFGKLPPELHLFGHLKLGQARAAVVEDFGG